MNASSITTIRNKIMQKKQTKNTYISNKQCLVLMKPCIYIIILDILIKFLLSNNNISQKQKYKYFSQTLLVLIY